ncbi:MAG: glycosyltransferase [Candidatus Hodarchaeota archaeon]
MARIVYISKYPPLEGGIAAKSYWLAQALGTRGHNVHIVTDRNDADKIHTIPGATSLPSHPKVTVYRPDQQVPWHIPQDEHRALGLLDKALEVIEKAKPDVIAAGYLVPYGLVAFLASQITGIPYVLSHGGSDIRKFVGAGIWPNIWERALSGAKWVITDVEQKDEIERWNARNRILPPYVPDPAIFVPTAREKRERPVLALIGKANYYWEHKGWHRVIDIWSRMGEGFDFAVVSQGAGLNRFRAYVKEHFGNRVSWQPFVPPWEMPSSLRSVDALFHFEVDLPFPMFSNLVVEALCCGTAVISDREEMMERYRAHGLDLSQRDELVLSVSKQNPNRAAEKIRDFLAAPSGSVCPCSPNDYDQYLAANEEILAT